MDETVRRDDIRSAGQRLDLSGSPVCVHSSLRSFGHVSGGARTVIDGLLAEGCTVLVPTFSGEFLVPPPPHMRPERNATRYEAAWLPGPGVGRIFSPETQELDAGGLGVIPTTVLAMEGHVRGNHPLNSFTAIGPLAHDLVDGQQPLDVYYPLARLAQLGGWVVLMGVDLTSMTALHLAEQMAGRSLFRRWANDAEGRVMMVQIGSCSDGFGSLEPVLAPLERQTRVGQSLWRVFPAQETLERAAVAIRQEPRITHCARIDCVRCNDAVQGGPILETGWM